MDKQQLQQYARHGAQARLATLDQERDEIFKMFPELRNGQPAAQSDGSPKARKDHMSPEARKRQADRMRAYWAERRAKKAAGAKKSSAKKSASAAKRKGGMSAEARKAQGERMKAFWAAKRAEKQAAGQGTQAEATGATNGSASAKKSGRKTGRKQRRNR